MCSKQNEIVGQYFVSINCFVCVTSEERTAGIERLKTRVDNSFRFPILQDHPGDTMVLTVYRILPRIACITANKMDVSCATRHEK